MRQDTQDLVSVICVITFTICAVLIAGNSFKTVSRDFNGDGQVDIVDLSIMAEEISTRNANK